MVDSGRVKGGERQRRDGSGGGTGGAGWSGACNDRRAQTALFRPWQARPLRQGPKDLCSHVLRERRGTGSSLVETGRVRRDAKHCLMLTRWYGCTGGEERTTTSPFVGGSNKVQALITSALSYPDPTLIQNRNYSTFQSLASYTASMPYGWFQKVIDEELRRFKRATNMKSAADANMNICRNEVHFTA